MPLYFQLFENYQENKEALNVTVAAEKLQVPHLIIHGTNDTSVTINSAELLHSKSKQSELFVLDTDHVFGAKQPWDSNEMPEPLQLITDRMLAFLKK